MCSPILFFTPRIVGPRRPRLRQSAGAGPLGLLSNVLLVPAAECSPRSRLPRTGGPGGRIRQGLMLSNASMCARRLDGGPGRPDVASSTERGALTAGAALVGGLLMG